MLALGVTTGSAAAAGLAMMLAGAGMWYAACARRRAQSGRPKAATEPGTAGPLLLIAGACAVAVAGAMRWLLAI